MTQFTQIWLETVNDTIKGGKHVSPRGINTLEVPQRTIEVDMRHPVLISAKRGLNYKFMAAEAHWILSGDDRVETIAPYAARIKDFSDDGVRFFGAYGPKIKAQLPYIIDKLSKDKDSRQAGLTIWRESPPQTKDVPCTIAIFFAWRGDKLNCHVFMRSSDIWLGLPYDVFNFSMLAHLVCGLINESMNDYEVKVLPGTLYLTASSSHLYEINFKDALECVNDWNLVDGITEPTPLELSMDPFALMTWLEKLKDEPAASPMRWWVTP